MNVNELITTIRTNNNMPMTKILGTKSYLPFEAKVALAKTIVDKCIVNNDGFVQINEIDQYIHFTIESIKAYTNIEFGENYIEDYDLLCSTGVLGDVIATFEGEYKMILNLVEMQKRYVLEQNKIEFQVARVANSLIGAIDGFGVTLSNKANDLDKLLTPESIGMIQEFMKNIK